jgi:hypothetical protein
MNRREFSKGILIVGTGLGAGSAKGAPAAGRTPSGDYYEEPPKRLPVRKFDVIVAGAGTAGVVEAIAAAPATCHTRLYARLWRKRMSTLKADGDCLWM